MARVNVETRALAETRFYKLCKQLEMSRPEAIGLLVLFWHDSQERGLWKANRELLLKLIPYEEGPEEILEALIEHDYVSACDDGEYFIHGNQKHIEALEERRVAGQLGGSRSTDAKKEAAIEREKHKQAQAQLVKAQANTIQSNTIQSITNKKTVFDFDSLYEKYPRKEGKKNGLVKLRTIIKTQEDFDKVSTAIEAYKKYILKNQIESKFIKHFPTFISSWEDWLDPTTGSSSVKSGTEKWIEEMQQKEREGVAL